MGIKRENNDINAIYFGTKEVSEVYSGSKLVYTAGQTLASVPIHIEVMGDPEDLCRGVNNWGGISFTVDDRMAYEDFCSGAEYGEERKRWDSNLYGTFQEGEPISIYCTTQIFEDRDLEEYVHMPGLKSVADEHGNSYSWTYVRNGVVMCEITPCQTYEGEIYDVLVQYDTSFRA